MKAKRKLVTNVKLFALMMIFGVYMYAGLYALAWALFLFADSEMGGLKIVALVVFMCLILLIASALLIDSIKLWAMIALPIQLALCLISVVITGWGFEGVSTLALILVRQFDLPLWMGNIFTYVEIVAIQALGIGVRTLCRKLKQKYSGIPF